MEKLDLKKTLKPFYQPPANRLTVVDVPPMQFLMLDGQGDPNTAPAYREAVQALYTLAYTLKFTVKKQQLADYPVMALEGLWWSGDTDALQFGPGRRDDWNWTMMIMQPDIITSEWVEAARAEALRKKPVPALEAVRLETFHEGRSVQIMHIGPYAAEAPTIARMHAFIAEQGGVPNGRHHEIYLSDPNRAAPEKLKTVLRQPFHPAG